MTQIGLKLFNKMPFVGFDIDEFFGGRACAENEATWPSSA